METNPKNKIMKNISGLLLSAGLSGRMGTSKALMPHHGLPFAVLIIKKLLLVCSEVSVVTGHESKKVETGIKNYLKVDEISILLNLNVDEVEKCLELLCGTGLVIKKEKATATLYSLKNNKVCDAMLMLKDELNKTIPGNI